MPLIGDGFYRDDPVETTIDITSSMAYPFEEIIGSDPVIINKGSFGVIAVDDYWDTGYVVVDFNDGRSFKIKTEWIKFTSSNNVDRSDDWN